MSAWTAVILTGGASRRMGRDKASLELGGRSLLERVVEAAQDAEGIVVVGPPPPEGLGTWPQPARPSQGPEPADAHALQRGTWSGQPRPTGPLVRWTREEPPGSGPAAALVAALPLVTTPVLVALATDLPFVAGLPPVLAGRAARSGADAVVPLDASGRDQPLCAAYRADALREAADRLGDPAGASMRSLLAHLRVDRFRPPAATVDPTTDVDTPDELARARGAWEMQDWIEAVRRELGIADDVEVSTILDVARDAAHNVQRPAAPVTTYLLGLAVGSGTPLAEAAARISRLADEWPSADSPAGD